MIAVKLAVIVVGAGALFSLFTPELDADLLLAVFACFSKRQRKASRFYAAGGLPICLFVPVHDTNSRHCQDSAGGSTAGYRRYNHRRRLASRPIGEM